MSHPNDPPPGPFPPLPIPPDQRADALAWARGLNLSDADLSDRGVPAAEFLAGLWEVLRGDPV